MNRRLLISARALLACGIVFLSLDNAAMAQGAKASTWKPPRTEFGYPDLQGNWNNATITPIERPTEFGERRSLTQEEANKLEGVAAARVEEGNKPTDPKKGIQDLPVNCAPGFSG